MKMWAVWGPGYQGILAGMKEFLERTGYTCRELEVKEADDAQ